MEDQFLFALDDCCRTLLVPALEACSNLRGSRHYRELSLRLTLMEAVVWLDVGVGMGVFEVGITQSVLLQIGSSLDEQFGLLPDELKARFDNTPLARAGQVLYGAQIGKSFEITSPYALLSRFQGVLGLTARLNADRGVASTVAALTILDPPAWEKLLGVPLSGGDLKNALYGDSDPWIVGYASIAKAGCFSLIEYLDGVLNAVRFDQMPEGVSTEDWIKFRRLISWVTSVRLDFANDEFTERFKKLLEAVGNTATGELRLSGLETESVGWYDYARALIQGWRDLSVPRGNTATGR